MIRHRYWVIGGEYDCLAFKALKPGRAPTVAGPFETRAEARDTWKKLSGEHSSRAAVRFSIATEELVLPN